MWGPMLGKRFVVFIDDFNMPKRERYFAQPPVELMRTMIDHGGWYDRKTLKWKQIVDVTLVTAMGPPGGGRQPMTNRMLRQLAHAVVHRDAAGGARGDLRHDHLRLPRRPPRRVPISGTPLVKATIDIYNSAAATLRPTPAKPQYTFNVRDVSKVVQGVLMADKRRIASKDDLVRLWSHECCRVLADRLVDDADRGWFGGEVKRCVADHFKLTYEKVVPPDDGELLYCDFFTPGYDPTIYEQVTSFAKLSDITSEHLNEYNEQHIAMNLVLFGDAMAHVCRICRVFTAGQRAPRHRRLGPPVAHAARGAHRRLPALQIEIRKTARSVARGPKTVLKRSTSSSTSSSSSTRRSSTRSSSRTSTTSSSGEVPNLLDEKDLGPIFEKMTPMLTAAGTP